MRGTPCHAARRLLPTQDLFSAQRVRKFVDAFPETARSTVTHAVSDPGSLQPAEAVSALYGASLQRIKLRNDQMQALLTRAAVFEGPAATRQVLGMWKALHSLQQHAPVAWPAIAELERTHSSVHGDDMAALGMMPQSLHCLLAATSGAIKALRAEDMALRS